MRWVRFIILACVAILVQVSLGGLLIVPSPLGRIGVDLAAVTALFVAFRARTATDAMLACWILGMGVDLTTGAPAVGPMAIAYTIMGGAMFRIREALFRDRALTQAVTALLFVLPAHAMWLTAQSLRGGDWQFYGASLLQALGVAIFTALLAPLATFVLSRGARSVFLSQSRRSR